MKMKENKKVENSDILILQKYFPGCFDKEGAFDIVKFQEQIKDKVDITKEGFELNFLGKSYAKLLAAIDTTTVIKPDLEHNNLPENAKSENIYISGDNIDALKHLLKSYAGQIQCIYLDPPYNTGSDGFVYKDNFNFSTQELQEKLSITANEAERILNFTSRGSASHSAWLTFMYPRLKLAKELLKEHGGIFISIDDNELYNLKFICDEISGPENFVGIAPRKTKGSATTQGDNELQNITDYVMIYFNEKVGASFNHNVVGQKKYPFHDEGGDYYTVPLQDNGPNGTRAARPRLYYPIYQDKDGKLSLQESKGCKKFLPKEHHHTFGCWMWSPEKFAASFDELTIQDDEVMIKHYYSPDEDQNVYRKEKLWLDKFYNKKGTDEVNALFEVKGLFSNPKPVELVDWCLKLLLGNKQDNIVLDFFGGSATTAQAVMEFNKKTGANNKFILVQLPEDLQENYEAADQAGKVMIQRQIDFFKSINKPLRLDELGKERIIRAGKLYKDLQDFDYGFKHFVLESPSQDTLDKLLKFDKNTFLPDENILTMFGKDSLLTTWLNSDGYGMTSSAEVIDLNGYKAYYKGNHLYLIDSGLENKHISALIEKYNNDKMFSPENLVLFGYSFNTWSIMETLKTNIKQLKSINKNVNVDVRY